MITSGTTASALQAFGRLDAWYFLAPGASASRRIDEARTAGLTTVPIGGAEGLGHAWQPSRFKRAYANATEPSVPYLAPHDTFQYLPDDTERLSVRRTKGLGRYRIARGQILQTCSGRNLGPNILVDEYLAGFVASHDLIRIEIEDERLRYYVAGFLRSSTGQELLRRDKSGSVIDHITVEHIEAQEVPILDSPVVDRVAKLIGRSFELSERARVTLAGVLDQYEAELPGLNRMAPLRDGWTIRRKDLTGRLDAAAYDPSIAKLRKQLRAAGGRSVAEVATVLKPPGRYKTVYVGPDHGRAFMSGTQILQFVPAKRQFMAERAFRDVSVYELRKGWSVYMADGRAEKDLGVVAMIPSDRDGWLASGHVGRLVPKPGTDPGWLWLAARTRHAQIQLKALASGSVVDSTYPGDMESVILPAERDDAVGRKVSDAWGMFAKARHSEDEATQLIEKNLADLSGDAASA